MNKTRKIINAFLNIDIAIASVALILIVGVTFLGVIMRYVVGKPFGWTEEVQAFLMVWIVFTAGGAAFRTGNHAVIEMVVELFPPAIQKLTKIFVSIVVTGVLLYLCYTSILYLQLFIQTGRTTAILRIPFTLIYGIVPVSCILQIINYYLVSFTTITKEVCNE